MKRLTLHKITTFLAAAALYLTGGTCVMAQELQFPKRWQKEFSTVNPIFRNDTITICFLGDVMMHTKQIETARQGESGYDFSTYFMLIEDRIRNADLAVANMEFPLGGEPY